MFVRAVSPLCLLQKALSMLRHSSTVTDNALKTLLAVISEVGLAHAPPQLQDQLIKAMLDALWGQVKYGGGRGHTADISFYASSVLKRV